MYTVVISEPPTAGRIQYTRQYNYTGLYDVLLCVFAVIIQIIV